VDDELLKYKYMNNWDRAVNTLEEKYGWLHAHPVSSFISFCFRHYLNDFYTRKNERNLKNQEWHLNL